MHRRTSLVAALVALAAVAAPASAQDAQIDVAKLAPRSLVYSMSAMGNHIMDMTRDITREEVDGVDAVVVHSNGESGMMSSSTDLAVSVADFSPLFFTLSVSQGGMAMSQEMRAAEGKVTGKVDMPGNAMDIDEELPEGTLFSGMEELIIQATAWESTDSVSFKIFAPGTGVVDASAHKMGTETITVPAGEFPVYNLQVRVMGQTTDLQVRQEGPHILVRQTVPAQGLTIELKEIRK